MADISQTIIDSFDHVLQERNNQYVSIRKVKWTDDGDIFYDIRKYRTESDGSERILKGVSLGEDGVNELTHVLTEEGFGDTRTIINNIKDREDFNASLVRSLSDDDLDVIKQAFPDMELPTDKVLDEEFYDIRKELG